MTHSHGTGGVSISTVARFGSTLVLGCAMANSTFAMDTTRQLLVPSQREAPDGRVLYVHLNGSALTARTNALGLSTVAGGIVPSAIEGSVNDKRQKSASTLLAPITAALKNVNMNEEVTKASIQMASGISWLNAQLEPTQPSGDSRQRVTLEYGIQMEPKFDALQLNLLVQIVSSGTKRSDVLFRQFLICFVPLQAPDADPAANASRWGSDDAALVRSALDTGLSKLGKMASRGLQLTTSDVNATRSLKSYRVGYSQKAVENYYGKIVERDATGTMIETQFGDWVYYFWPTRETKGAL
jgi:hypothetical protein